MGDVVVVTGPPGAGKSAAAEQLVVLLTPSALVTGDSFFGFLRSGAIAPWREDAYQQNITVTQAAAAATGRLAGHCDVVYDGIVGPWLLDRFLAATRLDHLHYAMLLPPLETCLGRVSNRQGHGFTDLDAAEHMWREFDQVEIDSRHIVDNYHRTPTELARTLADKLSDGTIRYP